MRALAHSFPASLPVPGDLSAEAVGARIDWLLARNGVSRKEFAHRLGVDRQQVDSWINGRFLPRKHISAIARVLGVHEGVLLSGAPMDTLRPTVERPEFLDWLRTRAPEDLTPAEREWLASSPTPAGEPVDGNFYTVSLHVLRTYGGDPNRAIRAGLENSRLRRAVKANKPAKR